VRDYKSLLISFVEVVAFLLASFGGFLKTIAPPEQTGAPYAIGILSFLVLVLLLIISALARSAPGEKFRRNWIIAGAVAFVTALPPAVFYPRALGRYTWAYPPENPVQRLRGLDKDFTRQVKDFLKDNPDQNKPEILARNFDIDGIWTAESLIRASTKLLLLYAWLVMSLATAVFCLLEANAATAFQNGSKASNPNAPVVVSPEQVQAKKTNPGGATQKDATVT
jgi:hypothetical protein